MENTRRTSILNSQNCIITLGDKYDGYIIEKFQVIRCKEISTIKPNFSIHEFSFEHYVEKTFINYDNNSQVLNVEEINPELIRRAFYWVNLLNCEEVAWEGDIVYNFQTGEGVNISSISNTEITNYFSTKESLNSYQNLIVSKEPLIAKGMLDRELFEERRLKVLCESVMSRLLSSTPFIPLEWMDELNDKDFFKIHLSRNINELEFIINSLKIVRERKIFSAPLTLQQLTLLSLLIIEPKTQRYEQLTEDCEELNYIKENLLPRLIKNIV